MEWYNSFAEMLVSLFPLIIAIIAASCYIEDDEKKSDGNDYHNIILPREDWTKEMEDEFRAMCEEERRIAREKRRRTFERIIQQLKKNGVMPMSYQTIYDQLRANGFTEAGALGMLGNFDCESNCIPYRLQGDFSQHHNVSKQYTLDVDSGSISRQQFANDSKGYGLAQWTWSPRKEALWDFWKMRGGSIGDEHLQVEFAVSELVSDYQNLLGDLRSSNDLYECTKKICYQFENPDVKNVDDRFRAATRIKNEIDLNPQPVPPEPPGPEPEPPAQVYWPPRTIDCNCVDWPEVTVLGSVLYCRGYLSYASGAWDDEVTEAVKDFQLDNGLKTDGVVGPKTWATLFERG